MDNRQNNKDDDIRIKILKRLKGSNRPNAYISGELFSNELKITRSAVWKHINALRKIGYVIDSVPNKGYKLTRSPDLILPFELRSELINQTIGKEIFHYSTVSSTNKIARELAEEGAGDGTIIIAETQSSGRGRRGRSWESPPGGLWFTILLKPKLTPINAPIITLLTGVVCANAIYKVTQLDVTLKWPNDVQIGGKKVCGILTELSSELDIINYVLVGVGFNVNNSVSDFPNDLQAKVTTLKNELKKPLNRVELLVEFLKEFESLYLPFVKDPIIQIPDIIKMWREKSDTIGKDVKIETISGSITGIATDISNNGSLLITTKSGKKERVIAGDCIYIDLEVGKKK